jgi:hypothetical protein
MSRNCVALVLDAHPAYAFNATRREWNKHDVVTLHPTRSLSNKTMSIGMPHAHAAGGMPTACFVLALQWSPLSGPRIQGVHARYCIDNNSDVVIQKLTSHFTSSRPVLLYIRQSRHTTLLCTFAKALETCSQPATHAAKKSLYVRS